MKFIGLVKRRLTLRKSYAQPNTFKKLPTSASRFFSLCSKQITNTSNYLSIVKGQVQTSWQEVWKPALLNWKTAFRLWILPKIWLIRDTISILSGHVKATVMPAFWHFRYAFLQFVNRVRTELPTFLQKMAFILRGGIARVSANGGLFFTFINNKIGAIVAWMKRGLSPILSKGSSPSNNKFAQLTSTVKPYLHAITKPANFGWTDARNKFRAMLSAPNPQGGVFAQDTSQRAAFEQTTSPPWGLGGAKRSFFSFFAATWQLTRRESLVSNLLSVTIVVFGTMVYLKRKEHVLQNQVKYGFDYRNFTVLENEIKQGDAVYSMLVKYGLTHRQTDSLLTQVRLRFNFERIQVGKPYTALVGKGKQTGATYLVFEPDPKRYFVFDLATPSVKEVNRDVSVQEFETSGKLHKTLYGSLLETGLSHSLINMVQAALKDKMDIKQCENGDEYKLIWEEEMIDGRSIGVKKLTSLYVKGQCIPKPVYAFYFNNGKLKGWYEKDSLPMRDGFIDSPVKNGEITSHFDPHRLHPILGYRRPHLGTDYAAPRGTPIMSVADGVVEEARYGGGNGRFVKIKHKKPYKTQYLHMSRFANGVERGMPVKQKQIIGYVGMSGLTTGPHVCFRFWKDGIAIDHLKERFFTDEQQHEFNKLVAEKMVQLDKISVLTDAERQSQKMYLAALRGKP